MLSAAGGENPEQANRAKEQYYFRITEPFRAWLTRLSSDQTDPELVLNLQKEWREQAKHIARNLGQELVERFNVIAYGSLGHPKCVSQTRKAASIRRM